jgi:hypothetical protein
VYLVYYMNHYSYFSRLFSPSILFIPLFCCLFGNPTIANLNDEITFTDPVTSVISSYNTPDYFDETEGLEQVLVVMMDMKGNQVYSKVVIVDVDMELSILVAKDIFNRLGCGIYTVISSSANDLVSHKLIIK